MTQEAVRREYRETVSEVTSWQQQALQWATERFGYVAYFNGNPGEASSQAYPYGPFPNRLAAGCYQSVSFSGKDTFGALDEALRFQPDYWIGYFAYDLKNELETLQSRHANRLGMPDACFFRPRHLIDFGPDSLTIRTLDDPRAILEEIRHTPLPGQPAPSARIRLRSRVSRETYLQTVRAIQEHILDGDVYELNYCQEFYAEEADLDPLATFRALSERSPVPFATFLKIGENYLMGASPERFLKKWGQKLIAQPIKGTIRRGETPEEDDRLKTALRTSEKEQAENLMIVDLMRNDLARSAQTGSVGVDELFGIYSFRQVHQMISTVTASLRADCTPTEPIRNAFPMGSMTGAPKVRAMELIDQYEASRRGLYSGAVGFFTPDGDFDFSVVIRSLLYNARRRFLSFSVGSAITYDAIPEAEYAECLLKARALMEILGEPGGFLK